MGGNRAGLAAGAVVAVVLCVLVWGHAGALGGLVVFYLTALSLMVAFTTWLIVGLRSTAGPGLVAAGWFGTAAMALIVVVTVFVTVPPADPAERDAARFGVDRVTESQPPVLSFGRAPTLADAGALPVRPTATGPPVAVPVQKVHRHGPTATLLVLTDRTCVLRGVLVGPAPAGLGVVVVMEPTELTGGFGGPPTTRPCGPDAPVHGYSVITVHGSGIDVGAVVDVGAGGPATPVT